ncbi:MAG: hypothetical protein JWN54_834, partial [Mycobacterium sp.]|nr:hypothetical protein [Mycobacterium sp.]
MTGKRRAPSGWAHARAKLTGTELRVATVERTRQRTDGLWTEETAAGEFWRDDDIAARRAGHDDIAARRAGHDDIAARRAGHDDIAAR